MTEVSPQQNIPRRDLNFIGLKLHNNYNSNEHEIKLRTSNMT